MRVYYFAALILVLATCFSACGGGSGSSTPTAGTPITVSFSTTSPPSAVAEQIGSGSWSAASLQGGALHLTVPPGTTRYGIAYICSSISFEYVIEATTKDENSYAVSAGSCPIFPSTGAVSGSVDASAIPGASTVVFFGALGTIQQMHSYYWPVQGSVFLTLPNGTNDIAALVYDSQANLLAVKIVRSQTVPGVLNNGNPITFAASDVITPQPVFVTGVPSGFVSGYGFVSYVTANAILPVDFAFVTQYGALSPSEAQAGDYYDFRVGASSLSLNQTVFTTGTTTTAGHIDVRLPTPMKYFAPEPARFPRFTISYAGFSGEAASSYAAQIGTLGPSGIETVTATSAYLNGATTLAIPDLTSLPGFLPAPTSGEPVQWSTYAYGGAYQWYESVGPNAGSLSYVLNNGTYEEP